MANLKLPRQNRAAERVMKSRWKMKLKGFIIICDRRMSAGYLVAPGSHDWCHWSKHKIRVMVVPEGSALHDMGRRQSIE